MLDGSLMMAALPGHPLYPLPQLPMAAPMHFDGRQTPIVLDAPVQAPGRYFGQQAIGLTSSSSTGSFPTNDLYGVKDGMTGRETEKKSKVRDSTAKEKSAKKKTRKKDEAKKTESVQEDTMTWSTRKNMNCLCVAICSCLDP